MYSREYYVVHHSSISICVCPNFVNVAVLPIPPNFTDILYFVLIQADILAIAFQVTSYVPFLYFQYYALELMKR